jgi:hypothetical protein
VASPGKRSFLIRMPPELIEAIERAASTDLRSTNAQIEVLLREALARRGVKLKGKGDKFPGGG